MANDAGLVFQPGVMDGSPCALPSTAPDTVLEALEEAATLFAQRQKGLSLVMVTEKGIKMLKTAIDCLIQ